MKVSVISPIRNEAGTIKELVERVSSTMNKTCRDDWEYLLIDDFSTDNSVGVIKEISGKNKNIKLLVHKKRMGQTGCFETGFNNAKGKYVITMDGDLQLAPEDLALFVEKMDKGYDVVNAIREHRQHPFWIKFASRVYNTLMLLFYNSPVLDAASNFTAFRTDYVRGVRLKGNDHRYIIPIVMRRGAKKIGEVIVQHNTRNRGKSKYSALPKYIKGFPELFIAWFKIKTGFYDKK